LVSSPSDSFLSLTTAAGTAETPACLHAISEVAIFFRLDIIFFTSSVPVAFGESSRYLLRSAIALT